MRQGVEMSRFERGLVIIDIETTGLDTERDRIVQIAAPNARIVSRTSARPVAR